MTAYFIKTVICSGLLLLIYKLLLEKETFHGFKRAYLLSSLVLSFLIPLIEIRITGAQDTLRQVSPLVGSAQPVMSSNLPPVKIENTFSFFTYGVLLIYGLVTSLLLVRFVKNVVALCRAINQNEKLTSQGLKIVLLNDKVIPHSFLGYVFLHRADFKNGRIEEEIIAHEKVHVQQRHSFDVLFIELLQVLFWFNPFLVFFKWAVKLNHEFLADASVVGQTKNVLSYQQLLLSRTGASVAAFSSEFNYSITKKRFLMMTRTTKKWVAYCKKLTLVPLLAGIIFLFSSKVTAQEAVPTKDSPSQKKRMKSFYAHPKQGVILEADTIIHHTTPSETKINVTKALFVVNGQKMDPSILLEKTFFSKELVFYSEGDPDAIKLYGKDANRGVIVFKNAQIIDVPMRSYYNKVFEETKKSEPNPSNIVFSKVEVEPQFAGGDRAWQQYVQQNLRGSVPATNKAPQGTYKVDVHFVVGMDGSVRDVQGLTKNGYGMEEEAMRILKESPRWVPAMQNGLQVQAIKKQSIMFNVR